ncbi:hypothetical protein HWV62_10148 [Athelia sp. TMB]|nr:hypothetical protein HWV62_10148 [Athelia sp. TMB]
MSVYSFPTAPVVTALPPARYDAFGRQHPFVESALQRRERIAFLRKREWARRVSSWIQHTQGAELAYNTASPAELVSAVFRDKVVEGKQRAWEADASTGPIAEDAEEEPYVLYSSSAPSSASSSASDLSLSPAHAHPPHLPADSVSFPSSLPAASSPKGRRPAAGSHRRRQLSLSSINEDPEE